MTRRFADITLEGSSSVLSMGYGPKDGHVAEVHGIRKAVLLMFTEDNLGIDSLGSVSIMDNLILTLNLNRPTR